MKMSIKINATSSKIPYINQVTLLSFGSTQGTAILFEKTLLELSVANSSWDLVFMLSGGWSAQSYSMSREVKGSGCVEFKF